MPDWRSIAMVLITTTIGGALDAALTSSSSSSSNSSVEEILGSELCDILRDTLVSGLRSFTCKAKDHDGVVLSIACASAYLQFPEFSKNGCRNAKKKAYADVLEALFWGATTSLNEELVFSNSSTKKTKDDISSPTLADEAGDRRLRIKDAVVIAINSDKSNGTLAGQLISSLSKSVIRRIHRPRQSTQTRFGTLSRNCHHEREEREQRRTKIISRENCWRTR